MNVHVHMHMHMKHAHAHAHALVRTSTGTPPSARSSTRRCGRRGRSAPTSSPLLCAAHARGASLTPSSLVATLPAGPTLAVTPPDFGRIRCGRRLTRRLRRSARRASTTRGASASPTLGTAPASRSLPRSCASLSMPCARQAASPSSRQAASATCSVRHSRHWWGYRRRHQSIMGWRARPSGAAAARPTRRYGPSAACTACHRCCSSSSRHAPPSTPSLLRWRTSGQACEPSTRHATIRTTGYGRDGADAPARRSLGARVSVPATSSNCSPFAFLPSRPHPSDMARTWYMYCRTESVRLRHDETRSYIYTVLYRLAGTRIPNRSRSGSVFDMINRAKT